MKKQFIKVTKPREGFTVNKIYPVLWADYGPAPSGVDLVVFDDNGEQRPFFDYCNDEGDELEVISEGHNVIREEMTEREIMFYNAGQACGTYYSILECEVAHREEGHEDKKRAIKEVMDRLMEELQAPKSEYGKINDDWHV
jgi:hypothetical protein